MGGKGAPPFIFTGRKGSVTLLITREEERRRACRVLGVDWVKNDGKKKKPCPYFASRREKLFMPHCGDEAQKGIE